MTLVRNLLTFINSRKIINNNNADDDIDGNGYQENQYPRPENIHYTFFETERSGSGV